MNDAFYTNRLFFYYYLKEEEDETLDEEKWKNWGELKMEMYYGSKKESRS